jgi:hypothetical protein
MDAAVNLKNRAVSYTASASGEKGSGSGRKRPVKPASVMQEVIGLRRDDGTVYVNMEYVISSGRTELPLIDRTENCNVADSRTIRDFCRSQSIILHEPE